MQRVKEQGKLKNNMRKLLWISPTRKRKQAIRVGEKEYPDYSLDYLVNIVLDEIIKKMGEGDII